MKVNYCPSCGHRLYKNYLNAIFECIACGYKEEQHKFRMLSAHHQSIIHKCEGNF